MSARTLILAVTGSAFIAAACGSCGSYGTSVVEVGKSRMAVASVSVAVPLSLATGQTARATATPKDANGTALTDRPVLWYSSSAAIASVNDSGVVSAVAPGSTVLSAVSEGVAGEATMAVVPPPPTPIATVAVAVNPSAVLIGQTAQATAILADSSGNPISGRTVLWSSSDLTVATVDTTTGKVKAIGPGQSMIKATSSGKNNSSRLSVSAPAPIPVASVSVSPLTASLQVGSSVQLSAVTLDSNNNVLTGRVIGWGSSNTGIASVSVAGLVTAVAAGNVSITASSEGQTASAAITASAPASVPVASVSVTPATSSLQVGGTAQLSAVTRDANSNVLTGRVISWSSSNTGISTVSPSGLVSAIAAGSATITALSETKTGIAAISVTTVPVASVTVSPASATVQVGDTIRFSAVTRDANNNILTGRLITWNSSNLAFATVSASGLAKTLAAGTVQITPTSEGQSASGTLVVAALPPPPSGSAEPSGMTLISERPFSAMIEDSWYFDSGNQTNFSIVADTTAPKSPSSIGQMLFPAGMIAGIGPNSLERDWTAGNYKTLYVSYWMKVSSNFYGQVTAVNKTVHVWVGDGTVSGNKLFTSVHGVGSGALSSWVNLQGVIAGGNEDGGVTAEFGPNVGGQTATVVRGQWQRYEFVFKGNTAGTADGTVDWWLDGVHVGSYSGIEFTLGAATWSTLKWGPTWGGLGGTVPADMYEWMDHFYVSAKP